MRVTPARRRGFSYVGSDKYDALLVISGRAGTNNISYNGDFRKGHPGQTVRVNFGGSSHLKQTSPCIRCLLLAAQFCQKNMKSDKTALDTSNVMLYSIDAVTSFI